MKKCVACGKELEDVELKCPDCESVLKPRICKTCGKAMPAAAKRCNACSTYRGRWKHLPIITQLAQILGGAVVVGGAIASLYLYFSDYNSHTHFLLASTNSSTVTIKVWNTGKKPSQLIGYHLRFDALPIKKEEPLALSPTDIKSANNIIETNKPVTIELKEAVVSAGRYEREDIRKLVPPWPEQPMTLYVDVRESSDDFDHFQTMKDQFRADRLHDFVVDQWGLNRPTTP